MKRNLKSSHENFKKESKNTLYKGFHTKNKLDSYQKASYLEELSNKLHLPADLISGAPIITATGRNDICIENYKGIIEYNESMIKIQAKVCKICIEGNRLNILYFTEDEMRVTGFIKTISYQ